MIPSIMFVDVAARGALKAEMPACFPDLFLDQIVDEIVAGREEYRLKPYFYSVQGIENVKYRYEVMKDLENTALLECIQSFAENMRRVRRFLALVEKLEHKHHKEGWFLEATLAYCECVESLFDGLSREKMSSRGLVGIREHVSKYAGSDSFARLHSEAKRLKNALSSIYYCIRIHGLRVTVRKCKDEKEYATALVEDLKLDAMKNGKDYLSSPAAVGGMDHVEAAILGKLAMLFPAEFRELDAYCEVNRAFLDDVIVEFDREAQFYLSYLDLMVRLRRLGLAFCLPAVSHGTRDLAVEAGYDLALAINRAKKGFGVICNDVHMENNERIFVVSGPNQGGKTTFARMFGQIHYLVALGLPLPAREARLRLADGVFTHFEKGENVSDMRGKLQDDLVRVREILHAATPDSIVILNEIFTSTTIKDATALSGYIMEAIDRLDSNCVWVTFIDEIVSFSRKAVSLVCTVSPSDPDVRTYKFERMPGNGLAYAESIARRYRLSYEEIMRRAPK